MAVTDLMVEEATALIHAITEMISSVTMARQNRPADAATETKMAEGDLVAAARTGLTNVPDIPAWLSGLITDDMLHKLADPLEQAAEKLVTTFKLSGS